MKKILLSILSFILLCTMSFNVFAVGNTNLLPSGISYSEIENTVDNYVKQHEKTTAAVSVAVFTGDKVIIEKPYGYTNLEKKISNDNDAVFEWGSCTKLLVWTSVMQLVEKGKIDLNKDIRSYLPRGFFKKLKYNLPITMLNLMNHNAGWQETVTDLFIQDKDDVKDLKSALKLIEPYQVNKPGKVLAYSNWGAALAGYIVERISGQTFSSYVHQNIFDVLGMKHTALGATLSDNKWVESKRLKEKCYTTENKSMGTCHYYLSLYPAGMCTGTIGDFIKFGQALLPAIGTKSPLFKKEKTLNAMFTPSLYFADGKTPRNCHGFWTDRFSVPVLWHDGGTIGSSSWFAFDRKSGTGMIILTNQSHESIYNCGLLPLVFGKYKPVKSKTSMDISGTYMTARTSIKGFAKPYTLFSIMKIAKNKDGTYSVPGADNKLTPISNNSFLLDMAGQKQFIIFTTKNDDGHKILQMTGSDYLEVNNYKMMAEFVLLGMFIVGVIYSLIAGILDFVRALRYRKVPRSMDVLRVLTNISVIVAALIFGYVSIGLFSGIGMIKNIRWSLILIAFLALIPLAFIAAIVLNWKKLDCTKNEKVRYIITSVIGLIMTANVVFWQAYRFW